MVNNSAFVFIKPHAVTDAVKELVRTTLEEKGLRVKKEGSIQADEIDKKMLIDKHYYAIASKATILKPDKLNVPKEKFKEQFGLTWNEALDAGKVFNAKDACQELGIDAAQLDAAWGRAKKDKKCVKFGGGFYCAHVKVDGKEPLYVFNGFFMAMRSKFVAPDSAIHYFVVEWDDVALSWADFRGQVLGATDPAEGPETGLRGMILKKWKDLGLKSEPNVGDNAVHASASPFEALAERMNWLGWRPDRDPFGKAMLKAGISRKLIKDWAVDPQVTYGVLPMTKSLFDSLEDTDSAYCLALCQMIAHFASPAKEVDKKPSPLEEEIAQLKEQVAAYEKLGVAVATIQDFASLANGTQAPETPEKKKKAGRSRARRAKKKKTSSQEESEEDSA